MRTGSFAIYRQDVNDPRWGAEGIAAAVAIGGEQDAEIDRLEVAAKASLPAYCPDDALDACGVDFQLPRYAGESNASYRAQLVNAFAAYKIAGSGLAIIEQLQRYGFGDVFILPVWMSPGPFPPASSLTDYNEFYTFLGPNMGTTGVTTSLSADQLTDVKGIILKWADVGSFPTRIILQTTGAAGAPTGLGSYVYPVGRTIGIGGTLPPLGDPNCKLGGYIP